MLQCSARNSWLLPCQNNWSPSITTPKQVWTMLHQSPLSLWCYYLRRIFPLSKCRREMFISPGIAGVMGATVELGLNHETTHGSRKNKNHCHDVIDSGLSCFQGTWLFSPVRARNMSKWQPERNTGPWSPGNLLMVVDGCGLAKRCVFNKQPSTILSRIVWVLRTP